MQRTKKRLSLTPLVRLGPKNQVTIPKSIAISLQIEVGDVLEPSVKNGKVIFTPKRLVEKAPAPKLTTREQILLVSAKKKILAINKNIRTAKGLTETETKVAAKAGLIDPEQCWWWKEKWQKGERESATDFENGRVSGPFHNSEELLTHLRSLKA